MMRKDAIAILAAGATFAGVVVSAHAQDAAAPTPAAPQATPAMPTDPSAAPALPALPGQPAAVATPVPGAVLPATPGQPGVAPLVSAAPGAATVQQQTTVVTTTPGLPALPGAPVAPGALPGAASAAAAVPTPPPLGELSAEAADVTDTTASISTTAAPSQLYTFLFIDDPEYGVVRQKFESDVAENIKEQEIQRLMQERQAQTATGGGFGAEFGGLDPLGYGAAMDPALMGAYDPMIGGAPAGGYDPMMGGAAAGYDPAMGALTGGVAGQAGLNNSEAIRAAAEWDFYYAQLEMYDKYVKDQLLPNAEDLPELGYTADNALQERQDLFESFQEAAIAENNEDFNDNKMFYERLQRREDRRLAYYQWVQMKHKEVADWAEVWARQVFGTRWADGEEVRVDDWYYGTDFNSANPVLIAIDDREYVVSKQPVGQLQDGQLNVVSNNLTPYDIIDANGALKNPVMETIRGTLVVPPAVPLITEGTTGTIEIVGSVETE